MISSASARSIHSQTTLKEAVAFDHFTWSVALCDRKREAMQQDGFPLGMAYIAGSFKIDDTECEPAHRVNTSLSLQRFMGA